MKQLLLILAICSSTLCFGQEYFYRQNNENTLNFVRRVAKNYSLSYPIVESNDWDTSHWAIIYFVPATTKKESDVLGYLLLPESYNAYRRVFIDTFYNKGGIPKIDKVFFTNADKDKDPELVILTTRALDHPPIVGTMYGTYIYDKPGADTLQYRLKYFKELSEKLDGGFEGKRYNEKVKAEYKNSAQIEAELRRMGY
jgi:hypothetical protein